jgi:phage shock protein C
VSGERLHTELKEYSRTMNDIRESFAHQGLVRPRTSRVLGGVCAGLGRRFGVTPWTARLLFVLLLLVVPGSQILVYPILWILMPIEDTTSMQVHTPPAATA